MTTSDPLSNSPGPLIAIIGSIDSRRTNYKPPLTNIQNAAKAAEEIGRELAQAECRIIVYSSDEGFIESDIVRGFVDVAGRKKLTKRIQVRYPSDYTHHFYGEDTFPELFDSQPDVNTTWEVSYYRSLKDANGIILLGGGRAALVAGLWATVYRVPLVAVATFGGSARTVWSSLAPATDLVTLEERNSMNPATWNANSARNMVEILLAQRERLLAELQKERQLLLAEEERKRRQELLEQLDVRKRAIWAGVFFLISVALVIMGLSINSMPPWLYGLCFFLTPMTAGGCGGILSTIYDPNQIRVQHSSRSIPLALILGVIAGFIAAISFVFAQLTTHPEVKTLLDIAQPASGLNKLIVFALVIGFIAGFTLEAVFGKIKRVDLAVEPPAK